jgi:hypothetical protein
VKVDEKALKAAIEKKRLKWVSLTSRESERAKAAYVAKTPGLT